MQLCCVAVNYRALCYVRLLGSSSFHLHGRRSRGEICGIICRGHVAAQCSIIKTNQNGSGNVKVQHCGNCVAQWVASVAVSSSKRSA